MCRSERQNPSRSCSPRYRIRAAFEPTQRQVVSALLQQRLGGTCPVGWSGLGDEDGAASAICFFQLLRVASYLSYTYYRYVYRIGMTLCIGMCIWMCICISIYLQRLRLRPAESKRFQRLSEGGLELAYGKMLGGVEL